MQTWEDKLSTLEIEEAIEILLQTWEARTTLFTQKEYQSLNQDEKELMRSLVRKSLADEIWWCMTKEDKQRKKLSDICCHDWHDNAFVQKHYPLSQVAKNLLHHLVRERIQQLESMKTAMNNFLDAIYDS